MFQSRKHTALSLLPTLALTAMLLAGPSLARAEGLSIKPTPDQIVAQIEGQAAAAAAEAPAEEPTGSAVSWAIGFDITNAYFFRGILQEDQGFIIQPYASLTWALYSGDGPISSVDFTVGIWNSFHGTSDSGTGESGVDADLEGDSERVTDFWYEADLYAALSVGLPANFSGSITYTAYTSPNSSFKTVQELMLGLSYDDSELWTNAGWEGFALNPSIAFAFELQHTAFGPDEGVYFQLGIRPAFTPFKEGPLKSLEVAIPVTVGLSISDYYEVAGDADADPVISESDDTFGYVDLGFVGSLPIDCIPAKFGSASISAGVHVLFLGDSLENYNNGDDVEVIGTIGFSISN